VHHNLRVVVRLAALLVLLGLGTVPVECAAVYGPHSIFISAEAVAQVRDGSHHHAHGGTPSDAATTAMSMPDAHALAHEAEPSKRAATNPEVRTNLPSPAGTSVDALIAIALFEAHGDPAPNHFASISRFSPLPADNLPPAPDPPPPQRGS
jgi:hypothetical protein